MALRPPSSRFTGPPLARLLTRLTDLDGGVPAAAFTERLSRWVHWTDAITLSQALDEPSGPAAGADAARVDPRAVTRLRERLAEMISAECEELTATLLAADAADPFVPCRRLYQACQHAMDVAIAPLRQQLRDALAAASPTLARLAALDAALERVIAPQERALLAGVPARLASRFERLRTGAPAGAAWWPPFRDDLQALLLTELDLRLQPVEGLLAALQTQPETSDA